MEMIRKLYFYGFMEVGMCLGKHLVKLHFYLRCSENNFIKSPFSLSSQEAKGAVLNIALNFRKCKENFIAVVCETHLCWK